MSETKVKKTGCKCGAARKKAVEDTVKKAAKPTKAQRESKKADLEEAFKG